MKEEGTTHWNSPNTGATNESGFTALPGGFYSSLFINVGISSAWWSSSPYISSNTWARLLDYLDANAIRGYYYNKSGYSVRCVKD